MRGGNDSPISGAIGAALVVLIGFLGAKLGGVKAFIAFAGALQALWGQAPTQPVDIDVTAPEFMTSNYINDIKDSFIEFYDTQIFVEPTEGYDRDNWRHWDNYGASCWSIREEVLYRQAITIDTMRDKNGDATDNKNDACEITSGEWFDPYTGETFVNPQDLDIDHYVPLGEAYKSGANTWNEAQKREYANDLSNPVHLIAVSASANRSKGARDPSEWMPVNEAYRCQYLLHWVDVKQRWDLGMDIKEAAFIAEEMETC